MVVHKRSMHIRIEKYQNGVVYSSLSKENKDIRKLRESLENDYNFDLCETITQ